MARYSKDNTIARCPRTYGKPGSFGDIMCDPNLCPHALSAQVFEERVVAGTTSRRAIEQIAAMPDMYPDCYQRRKKR